MFSVLSSDPVSSYRVLLLGEGVSRRTGSRTRPRRAFFWSVKTRTRSRRGLSNFAQTRARTRRVVLCPRPTALLLCCSEGVLAKYRRLCTCNGRYRMQIFFLVCVVSNVLSHVFVQNAEKHWCFLITGENVSLAYCLYSMFLVLTSVEN